MERDDVYMLLNPQLMSELVVLDPSFRSCLRSNGSGVVRLKKALYGCLESALLWYKHLNATLVDAGYRQNEYDNCVYMGHGAIMLVYVDDVFIAAESEEAKARVVDVLRKKYVEVTVHEGVVHDYLGMQFTFRGSLVDVTMKRHIDEILEDYEDSEKETPATGDLYVRGNSRGLSRENAERFHSLVAKMLWSAKRTRPDILTAVTYLTTRVQSPSDQDWKKLQRVRGYLKATREKILTLGILGLIQLMFWGDAAFDVHEGALSHGGLLASFGIGCLFMKSFKHKLNSGSSSEAELVTLWEAVVHVAWARMFLFCLGYIQRATVIYQDNKSTIMLAENGPSNSGKSKHFRRRYFGVKEMIAHGEVVLVHLPTEEMVADALTKPLTEKLFQEMVRRMHGETTMYGTTIAEVEEPC